MVHVGTSGFSYDDWRGVFYPQDIRGQEMLSFYARRFDAVELNFTYYRLPGPKSMETLEKKTPEGFQVCVKAHRDMTHETRDAARTHDAFRLFRAAVEPLLAAGKLGCVLAQFPWSFRRTPAAEEYLLRFRDGLPGMALVTEFRNSQWVSPQVFDFLRRNDLGFCCVDEPPLRGLMPPVVEATSRIGYVRFHGRNAAKWWKHGNVSERYDYLYTEEELREWLPAIRRLEAATGRTFVFYNNCHAGQAPRNAQMMQALLDL